MIGTPAGVQRSAVVVGLAGAVAGAALYTFSPMTLIFAGAMAVVLMAAARGLSGTERTWVVGALALALGIRLIGLVAVYSLTDPFREDFNALFGDGRFSIERSMWILNEWEGTSIGPLYRLGIYYPYGNVAYDRALALIQWFIGPSPYGLTLISVVAFFAAAVLLYRLARPLFGPVAATGGFVALLFWPTFAVWSISMLRESLHLLVAATGIAAAVQVSRAEGWRRRLPLLGLVAMSVMLVAPLRTGGHFIVLAAIVCGYGAVAVSRRSLAVAGVVILAIATLMMTREPVVQARIQTAVADGLHYHVGHVATGGKAYRAADQYFYDQWPASPAITFDEGARYLLRSAAMFVLAPLPSHVVSATELMFLPQHFAWILLVLLAGAGTVAGMRRDALLTGMCAGYCAAAFVVIAPYSGNIGTLVRHRDMIVPFMVWLSGMGVVGILERLRTHRYAGH